MRTNPGNGVPWRTILLAQRPMGSFAVAALAGLMFGLTFGLALPSCSSGQEAKPPSKSKKSAALNASPAAGPKPVGVKPNFDKVGPQVGDQLPNLNLRTIKGEPQHLSDAWRSGPALLVTSSLTCPKSRSRWPEVKAIADKYGEKLNVVIVYVIEAHPVGSICPYKGVEDVTPENERDGILRQQPTTLEERLELALELKRYLRVSVPIYIDNVNNQAWKAFGAAPNLALLVDADGIVVAREGWFKGQTMQPTIDKYLAAAAQSAPHARHQPEMTRDEEEAGGTLLEKAGLQTWDLRDAIRNNNTADLARILKQTPALAKYKFSIEQGHNQETTLLMEAVSERNVAAAMLLLSQGADVQARTSSFDSALQFAAQEGQLDMVKLLLRNHADPAVPRSGKTLLHEALLAGHQDISKLLAESGAPTDIYADIALGEIAAVRKALVADPSLALRPDGADRMPLDYAAASGQIEIAKLLLASGAPVVEDARVPLDPPLHRAIERDDAPMVKLLLDAGSSPDTAVGGRGEGSYWTPALHAAVAKGNLEIVKLLVPKANLGVRNTYSQTALHVAAESDKPEIVEVLIQAGADVSAPQLRFSLPCGSGEENSPSLNTPLHFAAARGTPQTIQALLAGGAKLEARNRYGATPLMATVKPPLYTGIAEESQLQNVAALIAAEADINARNKQGQTVLDAAIADRIAQQKRSANRGGDGKDTQRLSDLIELLEKHGAKKGAPKPQQ